MYFQLNVKAIKDRNINTIFQTRLGKIGYDYIELLRERYNDKNIKPSNVNDERTCYHNTNSTYFNLTDEFEDFIKDSKKFNGSNEYTIYVDEEFLGLFDKTFEIVEKRRTYRKESYSDNPFKSILYKILDLLSPIYYNKYIIKNEINIYELLNCWRKLGFPETMTKKMILNLK